MKIFLKLPGGELYLEREPMDKYKFYTMWVCVAVMVVAIAFSGVLTGG